MFAQQIKDVKPIRLGMLAVDSSGSLAYEFGRAYLTLREGSTVTDRYVVLWRKTTDGWRAKTDFLAEGWTD